jgi:hypothetical protein
MKRIKTICLLSSLILITVQLNAQVIEDISNVNNIEVWKIHNRIVTYHEAENAILVNAQPGDGLVWLNDFKFGNGIIELDIKGCDTRGRSFVGFAFHGLDEETFDGIYFRPFNFKSPERKGHAVQYISHPEKTWNFLRSNFPEQYENPVTPVPDPNEWFHAKIEIEYPDIRVYVNNSEIPSLEVQQLSDRKTGWIGFWTGNNSPGSFKNLVIKKSK